MPIQPLVFLFRGLFVQILFMVPIGLWWIRGIEPLNAPRATRTTSNTRSSRYAGKFCQRAQEERCDEEMFCTNGGKCTSTSDLDGIHAHFVCDCPAHRAGAHCEFLQEEGFSYQKKEHAKCDLECDRVVCAKGFKSYDNLIGTGPFPAALAFNIFSSSGEHCVCPDGYTGLRCEIPVERCRPKKYCYNGSTCAYDDRGRPMCDCNSTHTEDVSYAGVSCEQESTSHCTPRLDQDQKDSFCTNHGRCEQAKDDLTQNLAGRFCEYAVTEFCSENEERHTHSWCTNGGKCKKYNDHHDHDHHGCCCPDGYEGDFINPKYQVQVEKAERVMESVEPEAPQKKTGGIVAGVLLFVLLAATLAGVLYQKGAKKDDPAQFAADWWKGHTAEWWKGDSPIESDTNIAPVSIPKHIKGSWSYHTD